jgi:hypothetical protein
MKKLFRIFLKLICLFIIIATSTSCKSQKVVLEDGVYFSELDIHEAYLDQKIKETDPQDSDLLKTLKSERQELILRQNLLSKIIPKPKPSPCGPPNNCPRLIKEMDFLILKANIKEATLQILNSDGKILTEAKGVLVPASNLNGFSIFKMSFKNKDIIGMNFLKVLTTDVKGNLNSYEVPFNN